MDDDKDTVGGGVWGSSDMATGEQWREAGKGLWKTSFYWAVPPTDQFQMKKVFKQLYLFFISSEGRVNTQMKGKTLAENGHKIFKCSGLSERHYDVRGFRSLAQQFMSFFDNQLKLSSAQRKASFIAQRDGGSSDTDTSLISHLEKGVELDRWRSGRRRSTTSRDEGTILDLWADDGWVDSQLRTGLRGLKTGSLISCFDLVDTSDVRPYSLFIHASTQAVGEAATCFTSETFRSDQHGEIITRPSPHMLFIYSNRRPIQSSWRAAEHFTRKHETEPTPTPLGLVNVAAYWLVSGAGLWSGAVLAGGAAYGGARRDAAWAHWWKPDDSSRKQQRRLSTWPTPLFPHGVTNHLLSQAFSPPPLPPLPFVLPLSFSLLCLKLPLDELHSRLRSRRPPSERLTSHGSWGATGEETVMCDRWADGGGSAPDERLRSHLWCWRRPRSFSGSGERRAISGFRRGAGDTAGFTTPWCHRCIM